jgi:hypothetical protein
MEDPALEDDYVDDVIAEIRQIRAQMMAMSPEEREARLQEVREQARRNGTLITEDHPMHPNNLRRRWTPEGMVWISVVPPRPC